jgi:hypothetical protein
LEDEVGRAKGEAKRFEQVYEDVKADLDRREKQFQVSSVSVIS